MKNNIYYLVQDPDNENLLVHPLLLSKDYYAMGSFYILGENEDDLLPCYSFNAILVETKITTILNVSSNKNGTIIIDGIGTFEYDLKDVNGKSHTSEYHVIKEVIPKDWKKIEEACHKHKLYFAGI